MEARARTRWLWASLIPAAMLLAALVLKPYWRDEYWSLYFSDPNLALGDLLAGRMREEVHPPLYYVLLHFWRMILDTDVFARLLALPILAIGAFFAWRLYRGREAFLPFLLLSIGSYWVIYYAAETRPYTLLFVLCALATLIAARALERESKAWRWAPLWALIGALAGLTHYFGALWIASAGLCVGIVLLLRGRWGGFFAWGGASFAAMAPAAGWIALSLPVLREAQGVGAPFMGDASHFTYALNQLLRGLIVKGWGSNPALWIAAPLGLGVLWRLREAIDRALLVAVALTIALAFSAHMFFSPIIKERAFVVIIPALFLVGARALCAIREEQRRARWMLRTAAPVLTILMPLAFIGEYFKDREELGQAAAFFRAEGGQCAGQPILAYLRGDRHPEFPAWVTRRQLAVLAPPGAPPPILVDAEAAAAAGQSVTGSPGCRIRGVAFLMPRNEGGAHEEARRVLRAASADGDTLVEHHFGGRRQIVLTAPP